MSLQLFAHPFSSYCWKVLIALYANDTPFTFRMLDDDHPDNLAEFRRRWPIERFPLLVDGDTLVAEATTIIEHLDLNHPGAHRMIPTDPHAAMPVRMLDRIFDNYVMTPMTAIVFEALRPAEHRDPFAVDQARERLDIAYRWLDEHMTGRTWAATSDFTLADCAVAPSLFYADWVQPIGDRPALSAYRARLLAHPPVARVIDEARPYRAFFPLGAPDRD